MALAPEANIKPPAPLPPKHSLLDFVVTDENGFDPNVEDGVAGDRWQGGFQVLEEPCDEPGWFDPCSTGDDREKDLDVGEREDPNRYTPFVAYVPYSCTAAGFPRTGYEDRVLGNLDAGFAKAVEASFWQDLLDADSEDVSDSLDSSGGPLSPKLALASLIQGLAECARGSIGVIHAPAGIVQLWWDSGALSEDDEGRYRTSRGDFVVGGSGYAVESPIQAYATGLVEVRLSDPFLVPDSYAEAFDRATNNVTFLAERVAAVTHSGCCILSVEIDPS